MFDASPSQPQQPCPSDDDANAQQIELSNSRDSSSDSSKEYLPQNDVDQQTGFAENDRDIPASNFSSTPKTNINKRRSRLEFGHDEDDQSEAAPQHEKIRIEFNQDSLLKLFQIKLAGVTNNAGPSESEHVARLLLKLPLNSVNEMTEFVGEINDAIADKSITIGNALKLEGGSTAEKLTINILKAVVSLELARKFTYFGVKTKDGDGDRLAFSSTFICNELLKISVRENFPKSELDEEFFKKHISNWLNGSKDTRKKNLSAKRD
ncbi:hypothetical protein GHT06_013397 [Daphnia sinensis]|uniref:DUF4806 domain-containing protein n=1 Tax=Daphnia sinensis TaxID=1820382 RepID=A0AAD5PX03_9CRUS|nr:hypothetical protein GHT06_013397 [Daphnia sinensis]